MAFVVEVAVSFRSSCMRISLVRKRRITFNSGFSIVDALHYFKFIPGRDLLIYFDLPSIFDPFHGTFQRMVESNELD